MGSSCFRSAPRSARRAPWLAKFLEESCRPPGEAPRGRRRLLPTHPERCPGDPRGPVSVRGPRESGSVDAPRVSWYGPRIGKAMRARGGSPLPGCRWDQGTRGLVEGACRCAGPGSDPCFLPLRSSRERKQCNPRVRQSGKMPDTCGKGRPNSVKQSPGSPEEP